MSTYCTLIPCLARAVKSCSASVQVMVWLAGLYTSYTESRVAVNRFDSNSSVWSLHQDKDNIFKQLYAISSSLWAHVLSVFQASGFPKNPETDQLGEACKFYKCYIHYGVIGIHKCVIQLNAALENFKCSFFSSIYQKNLFWYNVYIKEVKFCSPIQCLVGKPSIVLFV